MNDAPAQRASDSGRRRLIIGVMGGSVVPDGHIDLTHAEQCGRLIAEAGALLLTGGRYGVMGAASKGAFDAGGEVLAILPGADTSAMNPWVTIPIVTGAGYSRNTFNTLTADAIIAIGGSHGTLTEIGYALLTHDHVFGLGTWALTRPDGTPESRLVAVASPAEAVTQALKAALTRRSGSPR